MAFDLKAHGRQQFGGAGTVGGAIAGRIVRRHLDQFRQKGDLLVMMGSQPICYLVVFSHSLSSFELIENRQHNLDPGGNIFPAGPFRRVMTDAAVTAQKDHAHIA